MKSYMINKGELYMEYENIDEATRYQEACRKVKQIAEAIKSIRIKYYPNFAKISEEDKKIYDELNNQIEKIAGENGLNKLKAELISEINDKYEGKIPSMNEQEEEPEDRTKLSEKTLKAYYGAIDAGKQALSEGKLKRAGNCQKQANKLEETLKKMGKEYFEEATNYKRKKFAELVPTKEKTNWEEVLPDCYESGDIYVQKRTEAQEEIAGQIKSKEEPTRTSTNEFIME